MKIIAILCIVLSAALVAQACCGSCPEGWTQWKGHCYRYFNQPRLNFDASDDYCKSYLSDAGIASCTSAHLVKVDSGEENDFLWRWWKSMREPTDARQHVRLGYSDRSQEGTWKWLDGSPGFFTAWDNNQPDNGGGHQDCVVMWKRSDSDTGRWDDESCGAARAFFCEFTL